MGLCPFRIQYIWLTFKDSSKIVFNAWNSNVEGNPTFKVMHNKVYEFGKDIFGNLKERINHDKASFQSIQDGIMTHGFLRIVV